MERIVSLLPSSTEIVYALGRGSRLVGRSHECDFPPPVTRLPACTEPRLDTAAPSTEIDRRVRDLVRDGLSVYRVDAERLRALRPDVILTQEQCEVCAVTPRDLEGALSDWLDAPPRVLSLAPTTLADVLRDVERVARCLDVEPRGCELVDRLVDRITAIGERSGGSERPRVACLEWTDPLMGAGHWVPELVSLAGGRPVLASHGGDSAWTNLEALAEADPDVIVVMPCGLDLARTRRETEALAAHPDFAALRAWREGRVAVTDGHQFFNRPGPRLVDSLEILAEILRPATFDFGHRGQDWQAL